MDNENNASNNVEEGTELIVRSLLTDMITKVLLMRQQHLAKLNRERIRQFRERNRQRNRNEYMRQVREKKTKKSTSASFIVQTMPIIRSYRKNMNKLIWLFKFNKDSLFC